MSDYSFDLNYFLFLDVLILKVLCIRTDLLSVCLSHAIYSETADVIATKLGEDV